MERPKKSKARTHVLEATWRTKQKLEHKKLQLVEELSDKSFEAVPGQSTSDLIDKGKCDCGKPHKVKGKLEKLKRDSVRGAKKIPTRPKSLCSSCGDKDGADKSKKSASAATKVTKTPSPKAEADKSSNATGAEVKAASNDVTDADINECQYGIAMCMSFERCS